MAEDSAVRVDGLRPFLSELRRLGAEFPKAIRQANKEVAEAVAIKARASFSSRPGVAPKVAPSVKAFAQQRAAQVQVGGARYPFALGSEFGSVKFKQFPAWRGSGAGAGYSLFPTIRANREEIGRTYLDAVTRATARAFPS
ncbi:MAG: hypothetical protein ACRD2W_18385 [Acidimicrobiales bacterium]